MARMTNTVVRGRISGVDARVGTSRIFAEETPQSDIKVAQPAGFSSNLGEMDAIILALNGHASKRVAIVVMDNEGVQAAPGEVIVYSPARPDQRVTITDQGITVSGEDLSITATGDLSVEAQGSVAVSAEGGMTIATPGAIEISADNITWDGRRVARVGDVDIAGHEII